MNDKTSGSKPESIIDFGQRKINKQNFSKTVVLPKAALDNCSATANEVIVQLVQNTNEKYIKLTPIAKRKGVSH